MNAKRRMPTRDEFEAAARRLEAAGFVYHFTVMADDAEKDGVTNFGRFYVRHNAVTTDKFYLNYKTIDDPIPPRPERRS